MKLTIIGEYGKFPPANGATNCYLISSNTTNIVLDLGSASLSKLANIIDYKDIDCVVLSHLHGDHCCDVYTLRNIAFEYLKTEVWTSKLQLLLPQTPQNDFVAITGNNDFDTNVITDNFVKNIGDITLKFVKVTHPLETYAVEISDGKSKIVYTSDTTYNDNLQPLLANADIAIVDANSPSSVWKSGSPHISVVDICKLAKTAKVLILGHLDPKTEKLAFIEASCIHPNAKLAKFMDTYYTDEN